MTWYLHVSSGFVIDALSKAPEPDSEEDQPAAVPAAVLWTTCTEGGGSLRYIMIYYV